MDPPRVVLLAGALGGLNSTSLTSPMPSATPFPEPAAPEEPCVLQGGLHFQEIGSLRVGRAEQTLAAMLKYVVDPSISI